MPADTSTAPDDPRFTVVVDETTGLPAVYDARTGRYAGFITEPAATDTADDLNARLIGARDVYWQLPK